MNRSLWRQVAILAVVGLCALAVTADAGTSRRGFYIGGGGTYAGHLFEDELNDLVPELDITLSGSAGFNFQFGYRLLPVLSLEGEYEYVSGFETQVEDIPLFDMSAHTFTGNLRLFIPIYRVQPFFTIGIGGARYEIGDPLGLDLNLSDTATAFRLKGGVDGYVTRNLAVTGSFGAVLTTHDLSNPTTRESLSGLHYMTFQFGLTYRF